MRGEFFQQWRKIGSVAHVQSLYSRWELLDLAVILCRYGIIVNHRLS